MSTDAVVECVPNFSEGRDASVVLGIAAPVRLIRGVRVLDITMDADHHRSVVTIAGKPESVVEAAVAATREAVRSIDLTAHAGVHPRSGVADVIPFVPVSGITLEGCAALAREAGRRIWDELDVPVFFYGAGANEEHRADLSGLRKTIRLNPRLPADLGGEHRHPTAGVALVGARRFLIAYNIDLDSTDVSAARSIARAVRESDGGLPCVKALGLWLASRGRVQVSMNLVDYNRTSMLAAYRAVERETSTRGIQIAESELIGLAPADALNEEIANQIRLLHFRPEMILERRLALQEN